VVLEARGLRSRRGRGLDAFELQVDALSLHAGEALVILGPNGSGKSSLLRALAGLDAAVGPGMLARPDAGTGAVTLVFQRPAAFSGSVWHNVHAALLGRSLPRRERADRVDRALERFGVGALAEHDARTLSGGELRRLALARAFVLEPQVLLLDEPFDDLDAEGQRTLSLDLQRAMAETGVALAIVTHDLRRALLLADRVAVLERGRLAQVGLRDAVLLHPGSPAIARTVGMTNLVTGQVERREGELAWVDVAPGLSLPTRADFEVGAAVWLGIRPEHLKVDVGRGPGLEIGQARVESIVSDGLAAVAVLRAGGHVFTTHLLAGRGLARRLAPGDPISLVVDPARVHGARQTEVD
jgi:ABC-type Fe3+/spermidine/putrescine transport system ATPase subunit